MTFPLATGQAQNIQDKPLAWGGGGVTNCTTATQVATGKSGPGYLTIVNTEASALIYVQVAGVTSGGGMPIPAGGSDTAYYADVSLVFAIGSSAVGWGLRG